MIQIASLRNEAGLSQAELAKKVGTTQQQISRMESPSYEGHSLSMLRRVADVLDATVQVKIQPNKTIRNAAEWPKEKPAMAMKPDPNKVRITIRLDADIVEYFKEQVHKAGGGNYQTMINNALRHYLEKKQDPMNEEILRRVIREELRAAG